MIYIPLGYSGQAMQLTASFADRTVSILGPGKICLRPVDARRLADELVRLADYAESV